MPFDKTPTPLNSALKGDVQKECGLWPFLVAIAALGAIALFLFGGPAREAPETEEKSTYVVPYDPDLRRLEASLANSQERQTRGVHAKDPEEEMPGLTGPSVLPPPAPGKFRVAAAQIQPLFNRKNYNRHKMRAYIEHAAKLHVKIIVFPEAALNGYCDLNEWQFWAADVAKAEAAAAEDAHSFLDIDKTAESADGESVTFFRKLAAAHQMYVALPFIEKDVATGKYYDSLSLIGPEGKTLLHYRKRRLLDNLDTPWASEGDPAAPVTVATPFGRLGLLIGADALSTMPRLEAEKATVILHAAAFSALNLDRWLNRKYMGMLARSHCAAVLANWAMRYTPEWQGYGLSRVINNDNQKIAALGTQTEERLVIGDLDLPGAAPAPAAKK